jgi:hypothetical protein
VALCRPIWLCKNATTVRVRDLEREVADRTVRMADLGGLPASISFCKQRSARGAGVLPPAAPECPSAAD